LKEAAISGARAVVIGGGFIGSEIAASLAMSGVSVSMIFPDEGLCSRVFPKKASSFLGSYYSSKQVRVIAGDSLAGIKGQPGRYELTTGKGLRLQSEIIVAGIGIQPDTSLAESAGLKTGNGIIVDEFLQTSATDVFAAGDVANFFCPALDKRIRVEHEDNANMMGEFAGINMAGTKQRYNHLPFFYSDLFDIGYEAVGEVDSRLDTFEDWKKEFEEGVIYYLQDRKVRGILLWNTWGQVENARALIEEKKVVSDDDLKGRLPT
jgi:NADPH-dependent 2,4-dienoyl-CoA reductase/sulfur reductase-like enzyme